MPSSRKSSRSSKTSQSYKSRQYKNVLEIGIMRLAGLDDGFEYCVQYTSGKDTGQTAYYKCSGGTIEFEHFAQLKDFGQHQLAFQVLQRAGDAHKGIPLFRKWVRIELPPNATSWKTSTVHLGNGVGMTLRVMIDAVAISEHSYLDYSDSRSSGTADERASSRGDLESIDGGDHPMTSLPLDKVPAPGETPRPPEKEVKLNEFEKWLQKDPSMVLELLKKFIKLYGGMVPDKNNENRKDEIDVEEFRKWLGAGKVDPSTAQTYFNAIDEDGSKTLTRLEIIKWMHKAVKKTNKDYLPRVESCLCFLMFASSPPELQPNDDSDQVEPVMTGEDLAFLLENLLQCTTYRQRASRETVARKMASDFLKHYASGQYEDSQHNQHKYLTQSDLDKLIQENPEGQSILAMWRYLTNIEKQAPKEKRECYVCCPLHWWPSSMVVQSCSRPVEHSHGEHGHGEHEHTAKSDDGCTIL